MCFPVIKLLMGNQTVKYDYYIKDGENYCMIHPKKVGNGVEVNIILPPSLYGRLVDNRSTEFQIVCNCVETDGSTVGGKMVCNI